MSRGHLVCAYKRAARCKFTTSVVSEMKNHVQREHGRTKFPKSNSGMAHCIWPECGFEHELPARVMEHVAAKHRD